MSRAEELEELEDKIDDVEAKVDAIKDVVLRKLAEFEKKLDDNAQAIANIKQTVEEMSSSSSSDLRTSTPVRGSPKSFPVFTATRVEKERAVPRTISDLNLKLQSKLEKFVPTVMDSREKLTEAQLAYVNYWVDSQGAEVTGKRDEAQRLFQDGRKDGLWWSSVDGCKDFTAYLQEKLKTIRRKNRRAEKRKAVDDDYKEVLETLNSYM